MEKINTLDIEASGIGAESYPIEIGVILKNGSTYCSLIKPEPEWIYWSDQAESIHGISQQTLKAYGKPARQVATELNELLAGQVTYSDCSVLDKPWLITLFEKTRIDCRFNLTDIMYLISEEEYIQLNETKRSIANNLDIQRHRATNDARILQLAYEQMVQTSPVSFNEQTQSKLSQ